MSRSAVLAILLSCVTALLAPAVAGAECETHLIYHRCLNLECPGACVKQSVGWTTPKTGETHLQEWCECQ